MIAGVLIFKKCKFCASSFSYTRKRGIPGKGGRGGNGGRDREFCSKKHKNAYHRINYSIKKQYKEFAEGALLLAWYQQQEDNKSVTTDKQYRSGSWSPEYPTAGAGTEDARIQGQSSSNT